MDTNYCSANPKYVERYAEAHVLCRASLEKKIKFSSQAGYLPDIKKVCQHRDSNRRPQAFPISRHTLKTTTPTEPSIWWRSIVHIPKMASCSYSSAYPACPYTCNEPLITQVNIALSSQFWQILILCVCNLTGEARIFLHIFIYHIHNIVITSSSLSSTIQCPMILWSNLLHNCFTLVE